MRVLLHGRSSPHQGSHVDECAWGLRWSTFERGGGAGVWGATVMWERGLPGLWWADVWKEGPAFTLEQQDGFLSMNFLVATWVGSVSGSTHS